MARRKRTVEASPNAMTLEPNCCEAPPEFSPARIPAPTPSHGQPERDDGYEAAKRIAAYTFAQLCPGDRTTPSSPRERGRAFFRIFNAVRDAILSPEEKCLLFVLASRIGHDGRIWISLEQAAAETGMHANTVAALMNSVTLEGLFVDWGEPVPTTGPINWRFHNECAETLRVMRGKAFQSPTTPRPPTAFNPNDCQYAR